MKKLITFDCYGTLLNTRPFLEEIERIGAEHQKDGPQLSWLYQLNEARLMYAEPFLPLDALIGEALERCDVMLGTDFMAAERERLLQVQCALKPFPEVIPVLRELRRRGYHLVIMSNSCHSIMDCNRKALEDQIDDVVLAEDVCAYKPQLSFFQQVERRLDTKEREHWHVAQGYFDDIIPGKRNQWKRVWVNREGEKGQAKWSPEHQVKTLDQILPLFPG